jgi:hypothetical protein
MLVDTKGLILSALMPGADFPAPTAPIGTVAIGRRSTKGALPWLRLIWADGAYTSSFHERVRYNGRVARGGAPPPKQAAVTLWAGRWAVLEASFLEVRRSSASWERNKRSGPRTR